MAAHSYHMTSAVERVDFSQESVDTFRKMNCLHGEAAASSKRGKRGLYEYEEVYIFKTKHGPLMTHNAICWSSTLNSFNFPLRGPQIPIFTPL